MAYQHSSKGGMYIYNGALDLTINAANQYHAVYGLSQGMLDGWTLT